jgi:hypothetical protein
MKHSLFMPVLFVLLPFAFAQNQPPLLVNLGSYGAQVQNDVYKLDLQVVNVATPGVVIVEITKVTVTQVNGRQVVLSTHASFFTADKITNNTLFPLKPSSMTPLPKGIFAQSGKLVIGWASGGQTPFNKIQPAQFDQEVAKKYQAVDAFNVKLVTDSNTRMVSFEQARVILLTLPAQQDVQSKISIDLVQIQTRALERANAEATRVKAVNANDIAARENLEKKPKVSCEERKLVIEYANNKLKPNIENALIPKAKELFANTETQRIHLEAFRANLEASQKAIGIIKTLEPEKWNQVIPAGLESKVQQQGTQLNQAASENRQWASFSKADGKYLWDALQPVRNLIETAQSPNCK